MLAQINCIEFSWRHSFITSHKFSHLVFAQCQWWLVVEMAKRLKISISHWKCVTFVMAMT